MYTVYSSPFSVISPRTRNAVDVATLWQRYVSLLPFVCKVDNGRMFPWCWSVFTMSFTATDGVILQICHLCKWRTINYNVNKSCKHFCFIVNYNPFSIVLLCCRLWRNNTAVNYCIFLPLFNNSNLDNCYIITGLSTLGLDDESLIEDYL